MDTINQTNMTEEQVLQISGHEFSQVYECNYASCYAEVDGTRIVCILKAEYIPISEFKQIFEVLLESIKAGGFDTFIFDKRTLRTFHQPSMEWYYLEWKTEALKYGVSQHFKILPQIQWFVKAVEIAKRGLDVKLKAETGDKISVKYINSLEEAIQG